MGKFKDPPVYSKTKDFERWKTEVNAWNDVVLATNSIDKKAIGQVLALSLPDADEEGDLRGKVMDAMDIFSKLTPDARSALNSLPLQTVARADELTHEDQVTRIALLIDSYIEPCFDRETFDMYRASKNLCGERPEFWSRLFAGIRPERQEMLPSVTQYDHCRLIDQRPVKPVGDVEAALKA